MNKELSMGEATPRPHERTYPMFDKADSYSKKYLQDNAALLAQVDFLTRHQHVVEKHIEEQDELFDARICALEGAVFYLKQALDMERIQRNTDHCALLGRIGALEAR